MALDLEGYYVNVLPGRETLKSDLEAGIDDLLALFSGVPFDEKKAWGYWLEEESTPKDMPFSQSTTSMIAAAILGAFGDRKGRYAHGYEWAPSQHRHRSNASAVERAEKARNMLVDKWGPADAHTKSSTYGLNDILSLSWHLDLFASPTSDADKAESIAGQAREVVNKRAQELVDKPLERLVSLALNSGIGDERANGTSHYILLRFVRCEKRLNPGVSGLDPSIRAFRKKAFDRFQSGLRDQISFADVSDSRFDPCELAFCFEGMAHLRPEAVDDALADRILSVLSVAQQKQTGWRPQTPLTTSHRGEVLYPIGVETATSLLCTYSLLRHGPGTRRSKKLTEKFFGIVNCYWDWLKPRRLALTVNNEIEVFGWRSERLGGNTLHIWENSQILEFLVIFHNFISAFIADETLYLSGLDVIEAAPVKNWSEIVDIYEPALRKGADGLYAQIGKWFIEPRITNQGDAFWSMLLYGPPGTGKTTTAQNMAAALNYRLIRVTVSDFLADGDFRMERRAKLIFEVLRRQSRAVVLFDELDQLVLDRDSARFRELGSVFQLLTPGMLTKLAELRESMAVIFILATNYEDRIDSAIKRSGRVDISLVCLQPDLQRRMKTITAVLAKRGVTATTEQIETAARFAVFLSHKDIVRVTGNCSDVSKLPAVFDKEPRDIQFPAFGERIAEGRQHGLFQELCELTHMAVEAMVEEGHAQPRFVVRFAEMLSGSNNHAFINSLKSPADGGITAQDFDRLMRTLPARLPR